MNVSKKILVIIYVIFALLISVIIFGSQTILYSSFSDLQEKEAAGNLEKLQNVIDFEILHLDEANSALASKEEIRNLIANKNSQNLNATLFEDTISITGCDFIVLASSSGNIIYSSVSGSENLSSTLNLTRRSNFTRTLNLDNDSNLIDNSILPEIRQKIHDGSLLCQEAEVSSRGLILLKSGPAIVSSKPVLAAPESEKVSGTIILGKYLNTEFIESVQNTTGNAVTLSSLRSVTPDVQQAFFESENHKFIYTTTGQSVIGYSVLEDISGNPAILMRTDANSSIYAEGQKSLRYIVFFLLFAGITLGAGCKHLLDREVASRIVAIDNFVEKVGKNENFSERFSVHGNDELSRLSEGINRMLDRLRATSERFKAEEQEKKVILNSLSELVIFMDPGLKIVWVNKAALDYMDLKFEEIAGRNYKDFSTLQNESSEKSFIEKAVKSGNEESGEIITQDGKVWMVRVNPVKDEKGRITGILQTGLDITTHKHSEERLLQAKLEAEAASRTKSEFLANMSHELRTPLNSIIGFSDILLEKAFGELNEKQLRYIKNISTSGKHLLNLINDILDLSKVEAGKMELYYSEFFIDPLFEEVKTVLAPFAQTKSLEVTSNIESDIKTLEADRGRLIQILYNLTSNAIKFTPTGGKVSIYCKKSGNRALISVIDTGIGISPEDQIKLFQPFTQIDASTSRQYCGTGLGLALVKKIVNLHQGDIWVESDSGKGSTFTFSIPLKKPLEARKANEIELEDITIEFEMSKNAALTVKGNTEASQEEIELPEILPPEKEKERQGLVLVVDDNKNSNELLSIVLREAGYSVASLFDGKNVLNVAKKLKPDIITLDVFLPDTNGWLVLRQLKNDPQTACIPVLIISMTNKNELGIALGAAYSFTKPVKRAELIDSLKEITSELLLKSPRVLIVDEDENAVELLSSIIEPEGFEVIKAYSGKECLQKLFSEPQPNILILDLMMPEISGFDVISSIRADVRA
ncbi:MAG TPA: response regulator, partial [Methanosarcina sp.]|nr:response regulator [Methanosarcina sp.]